MLNIFEYEIEGVKRRFSMGVYALLQTLKESGIDPSEVGDLFVAAKEIETVVKFMFHSAFYQAKRDKVPVDFDELTPYDWIELTGGLPGDFFQSFRKEMLKSMGLKEVEEPQEEVKKKQPELQPTT